MMERFTVFISYPEIRSSIETVKFADNINLFRFYLNLEGQVKNFRKDKPH